MLLVGTKIAQVVVHLGEHCRLFVNLLISRGSLTVDTEAAVHAVADLLRHRLIAWADTGAWLSGDGYRLISIVH